MVAAAVLCDTFECVDRTDAYLWVWNSAFSLSVFDGFFCPKPFHCFCDTISNQPFGCRLGLLSGQGQTNDCKRERNHSAKGGGEGRELDQRQSPVEKCFRHREDRVGDHSPDLPQKPDKQQASQSCPQQGNANKQGGRQRFEPEGLLQFGQRRLCIAARQECENRSRCYKKPKDQDDAPKRARGKFKYYLVQSQFTRRSIGSLPHMCAPPWRAFLRAPTLNPVR